MEHTSSPSPKKTTVIKSANKVMFLVFADHHVFILSVVPKDQMINAMYYPINCLFFLSFTFSHRIIHNNTVFNYCM